MKKRVLRWEFYQGQENWYCDIKWQQRVATQSCQSCTVTMQFRTFSAKQSDRPKGV